MCLSPNYKDVKSTYHQLSAHGLSSSWKILTRYFILSNIFFFPSRWQSCQPQNRTAPHFIWNFGNAYFNILSYYMFRRWSVVFSRNTYRICSDFHHCCCLLVISHTWFFYLVDGLLSINQLLKPGNYCSCKKTLTFPGVN